MAETKSIFKVNLFSWLATICAVSIAFTAFFIYQKTQEYQNRIRLYERSNQQYREEVLTLEASAAVKYLQYRTDSLKSAKISKEEKKALLSELRNIKFGPTPDGNIFVLAPDGTVLVHPAGELLENRKYFSGRNLALLKNILMASKRHGGGFSNYEELASENESVQKKRIYSVYFAPLDVIVCSEIDPVALRKAYGENRAKLKIALVCETSFILLMCLVVTGLAIVFSFSVSNALKREVDLITDYLQDSVNGSPCMDMALFRFTELKFIGFSAVKMVAKIKYLIARIKEMAIKSERSSRAKSCYLANMSHEIRNPLNGILGMAELLKDTKLDNTQREYLLAIFASCHSLVSLVNSIRDFSASETGKIDVVNESFSTDGLISKLMEYEKAEAVNKDIKLLSTVSGDVPKQVCGDSGKIFQVLSTLIENALVFIEAGSVSVSLNCAKGEDDKAELLFSVVDTGPGIAADKLEYIFDFAHQDISSSHKFSSVSLGLAVCKEIVEAMGGKINVASEDGKGSTFSFNVPVSTAAAKSAAVTAVPVAAVAAASDLKVLLVEDDPVNQKVELNFLKRAGCESIDLAFNGAQAVEKFQAGPYDIIFMDCEMPKLDGYSATSQIRELEKDAKRIPIIIALTANALQADREKCLKAGMDDHLSKPVTTEAITAILAKFFPAEKK